jgi:hypothetical protein
MNAVSSSRKSDAQWSQWASWLRDKGLTGIARWFLDAGEPLRVLGVQALYFGQPFLGGEHISSVVSFLEDEERVKSFAAFLEEADS